MTRVTKSGTAGAMLVASAVLVGFVGIAVGDGRQRILEAINATKDAQAALTLVDKVPPLVAGSALIGLGVGAVIASGVTYWYQNKQIGGRLK